MPIYWDKRNKRWRFEFDRYIAGDRHRTTRLLPLGWTQAKADEFDRKESARLYAVAAGLEKPDALIETAVELYLRDKAKMKSHRSAAEHLNEILPAYEGRKLSELTEVAAAINADRAGSKEGKILSDATVHNRLALLKAACRWGWKRHRLCEHDPTVRMQMPTVRNERHVYASRLEVGRLAWAADRRDVRAMILIAFYSGMRLGEQQRVQVTDGALVLTDTKNGDRRSLPIHRRLQKLLGYLPLAAPKITLQRGFQRARARAELPHIRLHDLRHSAASEMINADVDLFTVGQVLGHRDSRSTKRYSHLTHSTLSEAVDRIGRKSPHKPASKVA